MPFIYFSTLAPTRIFNNRLNKSYNFYVINNVSFCSTFKILSLCLVFRSLNIMCLAMGFFFMFILFGVHSASWICGLCHMPFIRHFQPLFLWVLLLSYPHFPLFLEVQWINVISFVLVPQGPQALLNFSSLFSLFLHSWLFLLFYFHFNGSFRLSPPFCC